MINEERLDEIHKWWSELDHHRGQRAHLRRCDDLSGAYGLPVVHDLHQRLSPLPKNISFDDVCRVAIITASVKTSGRVHPARRLAVEGFSSLRFQRLIQSVEEPDIIRNFRRAILSVDGIANIADLARGVITWTSPETRKTWAICYYESAPKKDVTP